MNHVQIPSRIHNYDVYINADFSPLTALLQDTKTVFVVDEHLLALYPTLFAGIEPARILSLSAQEQYKDLSTVMRIYQFLLTFEAKRQLHLVSMGGGIIQDVSGFAACTLYRGIRWTFVPTTLLAQADSCVGSKTSLNFADAKNSLGSFYPPQQIFICTDFLKTLPPVAIDSGIGEIIKFLLLTDLEPPSLPKIKRLVDAVRAGDVVEAIYETHLVKKSYIAQDEFDTGKRNLFNYGHCFGHALEASSHYAIAHGVAVTIGMWFANIISVMRGYMTATRHQQLVCEFFVPNIAVDLPAEYLQPEAIIAALKRDKKRVSQQLTMILLLDDTLTAGKKDDIDSAEIIEALGILQAQWQQFVPSMHRAAIG